MSASQGRGVPPAQGAGAFPALALTSMLAVQTLVSMVALAVPAIAPAVAAATALPLSAVGVFSGALYVGAMLSAINVGGPVVRYGAVRVAQFCLGLSACGLGLVATGRVALLLPGALLIGIGYGSATPASSHLFADEVAPRWRGLVFSIKQTGVPLGGMLAGALLPGAAQRMGWQGALPLLALACLVCSALLQPVRERFDARRKPAHRLALGGSLRTLRMVWRHPAVRELAISTVFFAAMQASMATYLVAQAHAGAGLTPIRAGLLLATAQAAGVLGRIAWGWASDHWVRPSRMLALLAVAMGGVCCARRRHAPGLDAPGAVCTGSCVRRDGDRLERRIPCRSRASCPHRHGRRAHGRDPLLHLLRRLCRPFDLCRHGHAHAPLGGRLRRHRLRARRARRPTAVASAARAKL
ncbi:MAG: MFS transporter [Proteobacteria bacterium]|nr:MFS transporter [Pseudomonadota bacterium]